MFTLIVVCIILACVAWFSRAYHRAPPPPAPLDLAGAQRLIAELKAELQRTHDGYVEASRPLNQTIDAHKETIKQLKRALAVKKAAKSELCQQLRGEGLDNDNKINGVWNSLILELSSGDTAFLWEMLKRVEELEEQLLQKKPHLRLSIEHMQFPIWAC